MGLRRFLGLKKRFPREYRYTEPFWLCAADRAEILDTLRLLRPHTAIDVPKARIGNPAADGGYVMLDDLAHIATAVSGGIGRECSWDLAIAERGIRVIQFDHTVDRPPVPHPAFDFRRVPIGAGGIGLDEIAAEIAPMGRAVLKLDIENHEWAAFDDARGGSLQAFDQITAEFHRFRHLFDREARKQMQRVLRKLHDHFQVVHVHGNNAGGIVDIDGRALPDLLEITFASRARYRFAASTETFPTALDRPNYPDVAELPLGQLAF